MPTGEVVSSAQPLPDRAPEPGAGDDGAALLRAAIDRHAAYIYRLAVSIVRDPALADDVVQETMIRAWRAGPISGDGEVPRAWLARVAHNVAIGILRRRREELHGADTLPDRATAITPARAVEGREALEELREALGGLAEADRALIVLREVQGMTYEEMAETLELPLSSVKTRLFRARQQLKNALEEWR